MGDISLTTSQADTAQGGLPASGVSPQNPQDRAYWHRHYANAFEKLVRVINKEKEILTAKGETTSLRLETIRDVYRQLEKGNAKPFLVLLNERCIDITNNINQRNFESAKAELKERFKVIAELVKE